MNFSKASKTIDERMNFLLSDNKLSTLFTFSVKRYKDNAILGEHDFDNKIITINKDDLYISFSFNKGKRNYTPIPKILVNDTIVDKIFITQCHEVVHAKEFSFPRENIPEDERERIALEDICCTNPSFIFDNHDKLLLEARATKQSIYMARNYFMNQENLSLEEANQKVVNAINQSPNKLNIAQNKKFISFAEIEKASDSLIADAKAQTFHKTFSADEKSCFLYSSFHARDYETFRKIDKLNNKIAELGFTNEFYNTLSATDKLYLNATINYEFYDEYKKLNPEIRDLPERLQRWSDIEAINPYKLDLEYFQDRLVEFQREKERKLEKEIEPSSGRF